MDLVTTLGKSLRVLVRQIVDEALDERGLNSEWLDQSNSLVGARQHINAVKALIESGDRRAVKVGRKYLVERSALLEKLREEVEPQKSQAPETDPQDADAFLQAHGLRRKEDNE